MGGHEHPSTGELEAEYWLLLGRPPDEFERREVSQLSELGQPRSAFMLRVLASQEFRTRYQDFLDQAPLPDGGVVLEGALRRLGSDEEFVRTAYRCLLDRDSDPEGLGVYMGHLQRGVGRRVVVASLLRSQEFAERYKALCPAGGMLPKDVQLCELANPAKWDNREWTLMLEEMQLPASHKLAMHRKAYEFTQTAWGLSRLGVLQDQARVLSVGAGHEPIAYWMANKAGTVIAIDMYQGDWRDIGAAEGNIRVLTHPEEFAPFPYRRERLRFLQMDGRHLAFESETFDAVYSLSSIEHFGGFEGSRRSVQEMARVTRPGGVLALATEWLLSGPPHEEVFRPEEFRALIDVPGLDLVEPIDDRVWTRYTGNPVDLLRNPFETPHMIVQSEGSVFTSVLVFLRKSGRS
jgi:SAM-dependent methyltransferase